MMLRALALVLMLATPALAAGPEVFCSGAQGGPTGAAAVCARLASLLAGRDIGVVVEITRDEPQTLAGRLTWTAGGTTRTGPVVEVTATDRPLDAKAADRLARGLLAASALP